jgi:NitT/TauT family transport system substrate-binding protein
MLLKRVVLLALILALGMGGYASAASPPDPVFMVTRNGQQMVDELGAGKLPAFIAWEPYCAEAVVKGYGKYLLKSSEIWPHHPCCIMAYDLDWYNFLGEKRANEILNRVLWVHLKTNQWIN